ncbi:MAG: indolepyruvate ferredoxin oxidoreductase subunit alpha, partial [Oscillospiraceae bacterium]
MGTRLLMGNEAIALGALRAGVQVVSGYPGTPSTEVLETIAKAKTDGVYVEWSVNEKVALEVAAGAAYAGARTMVTMKQMGLNVASDPLMCLAYIGVRGGTVILVADDPGPISSQTEQDTRRFARYAKLPVFDPSTVEEAY